MSQRSGESRPGPHHAQDGGKLTLPPLNVSTNVQKSSAEDPSPRTGGPSTPGQQRLPSSQEQQPAQQIINQEGRSISTSSRGLELHAMLNPTEPEGPRPPAPYAPVLQSPAEQSPNTGQAAFFGGVMQSTYGKQHLQSPAPPAGGVSEGSKNRKMLHPKSPRSFSLGGQGTGVFLTSTKPSIAGIERQRAYTATPGPSSTGEVPPMPTLPPYAQYGLPPPGPASFIDRRRSAPQAHSQSASPNPSYSSYSSQQPSPAPQMATAHDASKGYFQQKPQERSGMRSVVPSGTHTPGQFMAPMSDRMRDPNLPGATSHPDEMMAVLSTLDQSKWASGSKDADEKRKRNAAASARFRSRRKKSNIELAESNQKLETQVKELEQALKDTQQDRDFYHSERNRYREILYRHTEFRPAILQAPQSPRLGRRTMYLPTPQALSQVPEGHGEEERPPRKRRSRGQGNEPSSAPTHGQMLPTPRSSQGARMEMSLPSAQPQGSVHRGPMGHAQPLPSPAMHGVPPPMMNPIQFEQYQQRPPPGSAYERGWPPPTSPTEPLGQQSVARPGEKRGR